MTPEEHLALATIDPELQKILEQNGIPKTFDATTDIPALRGSLLAMKKKLTLANTLTGEAASYIEEDRQIKVRDGTLMNIRIHSPKSLPKDGSPVFVVFHGGGFCLGGLDNETLLCRKFTELGGVAVNVDYRLAPEHPFPVPVNDAYDGLKWAAEHFEELGGNAKKGFLVGGISAGANFAAVVTHQYQIDKLSPALTGTYLSIPPVIDSASIPDKYKSVHLSIEQNKDAPILNRASSDLFEGNYKPDYKSPMFVPVLFESHAELPPTYFQVCGLDPLRDEGLIYEQILREDNGIETKLDLYPGLPHGFWTHYPEAQFSKKFQTDCVEGMKWLLEQSK